MMLATRHYLNQRTYLDKTIPFDPAKGHVEMPGTLLIPPGYYKGHVFDPRKQAMFHCALPCTMPGLYQIFVPLNEGRGGHPGNICNRINASTALGLASAVATLHAFGTVDDDLSLEQRLAKLLNSPLSVMCGQSASVLKALAMRAGYEARLAAILTHEPPNYYSDGHMIAEIKVDGRWVAFDSSMNFVMCHPSNRMLSVANAVEGVWAGTTAFYEIAPFQFDAQTTVSGQWNQWGWCLAEALYDEAERARHMQRLYRIPLVQDADGFFYFYLPDGAEPGLPYALSLGYRRMTRIAFMNRFYGRVA